MTQEVVLARVLVEASNEVADRVDEVFLPAGGRIEQQVFALGEERATLVVRHAFEHLEVDVVANAARRRQDEAVGQVEEVVRGDADGDRARPLGLECEAEHPLVVRVGLALGLEGRGQPATERRFDALHLHVRALHDAQQDPRTPRGHAAGRPIREPSLGREK